MRRNAERTVEPGVTPAPGDRVLVIANPATRRNADRMLSELRAAATAGVELDVHVTTRPGEARDISEARLPGARLLIAIGGDGTIADCAQALVKTGLPLAVMPGGSTNITAREQGVPVSPRRAASLIFGANATRRIDAALCDERIFLHMAGAGFDARFFANTSPALKQKVGWIAYLPAAISALRHQPVQYLLTVDGEEIEVTSPLVLIANGSSVIHPMLRLHPEIRDDDGLLDLLVITALTPMELARTFGRLSTMRLSKSAFLLHRKARSVRVESIGDVPIEVDGDLFGGTPRQFRVLPAALRMIVPPR